MFSPLFRRYLPMMSRIFEEVSRAEVSTAEARGFMLSAATSWRKLGWTGGYEVTSATAIVKSAAEELEE
jgi:hypothetical protein